MEQEKTPIGLLFIIGTLILAGLYTPYALYFEVNYQLPIVALCSLFLCLLIALGLYKRRNFVRIILIALTFLLLLPDIVWLGLVTNPFLTTEDLLYGVLPKVLGILFNVWVIFYLTSPKIKTLFGKETSQTSNYKRPYFFLGMGIFICGLFYHIHSGHFLKLLTLKSGLDKNTETVYILEEKQTYKKGEPINFTFEDPLPVIGLTSDICFITDFVSLKELEKKQKEREQLYLRIDTSEDLGFDAFHKSIHKEFFSGTLIDSNDERFDFRPNVNTLETNDRFRDKGIIAECAEIYFDDYNLDKKTISTIKRPKDVKEISLTAQNDFTAYYAYWKTSDGLENFFAGIPDIPDEPMLEPTEEEGKSLEEWRKMQEERVQKAMEENQKQ